MNILIAGDFCDDLRVSDEIALKKYANIFNKVKPIIGKSDYAIVNFEFPVVLSKGFSIPKCGPNLKGQQESIEAIKYAGFKCCTLANNHTLDQGEQCGLDTKKLIEIAGMDTVGFGKNEMDAASILYKEINRKTLAVINCCEHEFSIVSGNSAGANALNPIQQYYAINKAREKADYILVIVHGGHEFFQLPSTRMVETYQFFIDAGADAVVNHHQHCYSGYEVYKGKPIFYGLGNFLFDDHSFRNSFWNEGYMVTINFNDIISFEIHPYSQCNDKVCIEPITNTSKFFEDLDKLNDIIADKSKLKEALKSYYSDSLRSAFLKYQPYDNKILNKLYCMNLLPSLVSRKKLLNIWNHIECESHRDKQIFAFNAVFNKK